MTEQEIVQYAKEMGLQTLNLITNGTLYNEEKLRKTKPYVDILAVSIDGYIYEHSQFIRDKGTFPKVVDFVKKVKNMGFEVCILPTLHRFNIDHIEDYMKLSQKLGVSISFSLLTCLGELEDYISAEDNLLDMNNRSLYHWTTGGISRQYSNKMMECSIMHKGYYNNKKQLHFEKFKSNCFILSIQIE